MVLGVAAGVILAEGGARIVDRLGCRDDPGAFWEPDRFSGWRHTPGASGWAQRCLRGRPEWRGHPPLHKPPGRAPAETHPPPPRASPLPPPALLSPRPPAHHAP